MSLHTEIKFEDEVCDALAAAGWLYDPSDAEDYDRKRALFTADVVAWVQEADPDGWKALEKNHGSAATSTLCGRLRDSLDQLGTLTSSAVGSMCSAFAPRSRWPSSNRPWP